MRVMAVLMLACVAGCASQPQAPQTSVVAPAPAATPAQGVAAQPAQAPQATAATFKPPNGYRVKKIGGNTVYCKSEKILGSIFPQVLCFTESQLRDIARRGDEMRLNKQKVSGLCGGVAHACGNE